jgi:hypothetical protein
MIVLQLHKDSHMKVSVMCRIEQFESVAQLHLFHRFVANIHSCVSQFKMI